MGRFLGFLVLVLLQNQAGAQSFVSETAGYNVTTCVAGSDTIVSAPFRRQVVFRGTLASDPVGADSSATLTLEDSPAFSGKDFVTEAHYLGFTGTSAGAGWQFRVISQGALTLGIDLTSGDLAGVAAGDSFEVIPYWTLDSLFPAGSETVHESPGLLVSERGTEILFFDRDSASIHLAPNRKFFRTAGGWKEAVRGFPDAGGEVVPAGASFVIRHPAGVADTRFVSRQWVDPGAKAYSLKTSVEGPRDNHLGSVRPIPVKLQDLDLEPPAFVESASTDPADRGDELHVFDNTIAAVNRKDSAIYFRVSGHWVESDEAQSFPNADDAEIDAGAGLMIRKAAKAGGGATVWVNTPRY